MAESKKEDERTNDYESSNIESVEYRTIESDYGREKLIIIKVIRDNDIKVLEYDGREIIKVIYTGPDGKTIKQAFYRSTGLHSGLADYIIFDKDINTERTWVPFDGVGYHDENAIVVMKRDFPSWTPSQTMYSDWKARTTMLYKCDYFGKKLAHRFAESRDESYGEVNEYSADDKKINKNFELARYGDLTTFRISYLLSSGDKIPPPFWASPLGQRMIDELGFRLNPDEFDEEGNLIVENAITIDNDYVEAEHREVNNFVSDFISYNWQNGSPPLGPTYFKDRRKKRNYDLRYSYMPTAKGTWVMYDTYLQTNPDSRLPMEKQSIETQKTKEAYDMYDSETFDRNDKTKIRRDVVHKN